MAVILSRESWVNCVCDCYSVSEPNWMDVRKYNMYIQKRLSTPLLLDKMVATLADDIFRCIFMKEKFCILIEISLKFVPRGQINNNSALV